MLHLWGLAGLEVLLHQKERFCHQKVMEEEIFRSLNDAELVDLCYVESPVAGHGLSPSTMTMTSDLSSEDGGLLERGRGSNYLKPTSSFPDCSQLGDEGGRATNRDGEIRNSSFSVQPRNTNKD